MKDLKHIKRFNESEENLNISDVRSSKRNYDKLIMELNLLKYEDGSEVNVKLVNGVVKGFKFYLTDVDLEFEKKIDDICKKCGFNDWIPCDGESIEFW
jgi:hypothetical protein